MLKKKRLGIDVAVVLFYERNAVPTTLHVSEITLPLVRKIPGFVTGLSGHQCLNGLMFARQYADKRGMEMIVIDLLVECELPLNPKVMRIEVLGEHDLLSMQRMSKELSSEIALYWQHWTAGDTVAYDWDRPADFVARRPDLLPKLLEQDAFKHFNMVTHPAMTVFHDSALTATSFRVEYPRITQAVARFHPELKVVL